MISVLIYLPTLLWLTGLCEFLTSIALGPRSRTVGVSVLITFLVALGAAWSSRKRLAAGLQGAILEWKKAPWTFWPLAISSILIWLTALAEARLPPHLGQEFDAIHYHMGLPRQHLLLGSLRFLDWSVGDLFPLNVQFGLAPAWFMAETFHKLPQVFFAFWAFLLLLRLGRALAPGSIVGWIPALAVFTAKGVTFQLGTAMLDLCQLYFALAALSALLDLRLAKGKAWVHLILAALHLAVFATFKSFSPFQLGLIVALAFAILRLTRSSPQEPWLPKRRDWPGLAALSLIFMGLLLGRTVWTNVGRAGTPLFPFGTCTILVTPGCQGQQGEIIRQSSALLHQVRQAYGEGFGPIAFFRHLWTVAVPRADMKGVNNSFDYPLGLPWLLLMVLLLASLPTEIRERRVSALTALTVSTWLIWWVGSQQARWLYPTLALGWLATLPIQKKARSDLLCGALALAAALTMIQHYRSLRDHLYRPARDLEAEQRAQVRWSADGAKLLSQPLLYVDRPVSDHGPLGRDWILR